MVDGGKRDIYRKCRGWSEASVGCMLHLSEIRAVQFTGFFSHLSRSLCGLCLLVIEEFFLICRVIQQMSGCSCMWLTPACASICSLSLCADLLVRFYLYESLLRFQQTLNTHYTSSCNFLWLHALVIFAWGMFGGKKSHRLAWKQRHDFKRPEYHREKRDSFNLDL